MLGERSRGLALAGVSLVLVTFVGLDRFFGFSVIALQLLLVVFFLRHLALAIAAMRWAPADLRAPAVEDPAYCPSVTVMVTCKNEEAVVEGLVESLQKLDYPADRLQLMVIDDGSTDRTGPLLAAMAAADRRLVRLVRSAWDRPGKAAALNDGLAVATGEVIVVFDADHHPCPDTVRRLVRHFKDPQTAAVQGRCEIENGGDSPLARLVAIDYLAGYLVNEYGRQSLFRLPAYGGANCAVRASSLRAVGGWNPHTVTEDTDLTVRLLISGARVRYDVSAVDREEGVTTLRQFWRQRYRWARGHQQVWRDYRSRVWASPHLSLAQKIETTMFLFLFHVPVLSAVGLLMIGASSLGLAPRLHPLNLVVFWTLLFLGPLLELGGGLLVAQADRRYALALPYFLPLFLVSMALCTKAWIDGLSGRAYGWAKTPRAATPQLPSLAR